MHICRTRLLCCRPSVRPYVTRMNRSKPVEVRILQFSLPVCLHAVCLCAIRCRLSVCHTGGQRATSYMLSPSVCPSSVVCHTDVSVKKRLKLVSCNFHHPSTYPSIRPSVSQSIRSSVRLPCASAPLCSRPSVHLSVCPSVTWVNQSKHG